MRTFKTALRIARAHKVYAIAFLVAVNMLGLITGMTQGGQTSDKLLDAKVNLAVVDRDHSPVSQGLAAYMEGSGNAVEVADSRPAMQDALAHDEVELIVIIPEGLGDAVENAATQVRSGTSISDAESTLPRVGTVLAPSSAAAPLMAQQVTTYVGQVLTYRSTTAASADQAVGSTGISMKETAPASVIKGEGISVPQGLLVFFGMALYSLFAFTTNIVCLIMRVMGNRPLRIRLGVSPEPVMKRNLGMAAAFAVVGVVGWALTYELGMQVLGADSTGESLPLYVVAATALLAYTMVGIAFGFFMGQLRMSENATNAVANIGGLVFSFLSGAWIPLSLMPDVVKQIGKLTPAYWANQPIRDAFAASSTSMDTLAPMYGQIGVCALFAVAIGAVALAIGRARMRSAAA